MPNERKERRRTHRLIRKIIVFLRDNRDEWRIRLERLEGNKKLCGRFGIPPNIVGCVLWDENLILVDMRGDVLATIVHEVLHVLYPDDSEGQILVAERRCMKHLTSRQAERIWFHALFLMNIAPAF